jgi:hypothetical protein
MGYVIDGLKHMGSVLQDFDKSTWRLGAVGEARGEIGHAEGGEDGG